MSLYRALRGLVCLAALALCGCNSGNGVTDPASQFSSLRVANFLPNTSGPVNVSVDSNTFASGLSFESASRYQQLSAGARTIQASVAGAANNILGSSPTLIGATSYTYVMFGTAEAALGVLLNDTVVDPGSGNIGVRVINAALGSTAVDVYVTPPGADLNAAAPNFANISFASASSFVSVAAGNLQIRVTSTGTKDVIFDTNPITLTAGASANVVVYTRASSRLVNVEVLNIDPSAPNILTSNLLSQFKIINGSQVASPLNVYVNGNLTLSNVPFAAASSYQKTPAGSPLLAVEATATPGAALLTFSPTLAPGSDTSIVFTGPAGALRPLVLSDNNLPPAVTRARVRFVNATTDISALDIFVNFNRQIAGLAMNSAISGEFDADATAGTPYEFDVNVAGTLQPLLKLTGVVLTGGKTYSVYVVGSAASLKGVVTQDN